LKAKRLKSYKIGIDLMGNETSPEVLFSALSALSLDPDVELVIIGPSALRETLNLSSYTQITFHEASDVVLMTDTPVSAFKTKKNASIFVGLHLLKQGKIDAFLSAGNTGALVLGSKLILSTLPKIKRPALLAMFPTKKKPVAVLDLGGNVNCKAIHLIQFALLASAYCKASQGIENPKIGLLNIGEEPLKGTSELRLAYKHLQNFPSPPFQFAGNIEGRSIFEGDADAIITDGFTGNTFLKTAEGISSLILDRIQTNWPPQMLELLKTQIEDLQTYLHYAEYRGALLLGVDGIVIKCHGYSSPLAMAKAVHGAIDLTKKNFMETFKNCLFL